jgi:hypothetical protein
MKFPLRITNGQKYDPAMEIQTQEEADAYFEACVEHNLRLQKLEGKTPDEQVAQANERQSLGYWAGYYDDETRERVERLFKCAHPFFGPIAEKGAPTPEEAFQMGVEKGKQLRGER